MRVTVIYRENSEVATAVETFLHDFERQTGKTVDVLNPDSPAGAEFCRVYDIVEYPTMLALSDDNQLQANWRGLPLPTISEVSYYA